MLMPGKRKRKLPPPTIPLPEQQPTAPVEWEPPKPKRSLRELVQKHTGAGLAKRPSGERLHAVVAQMAALEASTSSEHALVVAEKNAALDRLEAAVQDHARER